MTATFLSSPSRPKARLKNCRRLVVVFFITWLTACSDTPWNDPYPTAESDENILYASFSERPKHLDPARSYSSNEYAFIGQIYEPPLQYHYLKRPYELIPLTATEVPRAKFYDSADNPLPNDAGVEQIAYSIYDIHIRPGIRYQPHPAFATNSAGEPRYLNLNAAALDAIHTLADFSETASRELIAADYVYQIKRLAHPRIHSPILGIMSEYIVGLKAYAQTLDTAYGTLTKQLSDSDSSRPPYLDLTRYPLEGAEVVDRYTYRIKIRGKYPQLIYWLSMPFFSPMAAEVERFYAQPGMKEKNLTLDWYPVGTGAYMLTVNNPNRQMVLERNPNYRGEPYPSAGEKGDAAQGLLNDAGKTMPFIDKVVYSLEKENIPYWSKFLQGYYDVSGVSSDSFDQAISFNSQGDTTLTQEMATKGIELTTAVAASTYYMGFNMRDDVVGGNSERARKLRRAISIAVDYEEYISIFMNGRGIAAQGIIPPGIFGYRSGKQGINPYVYDWVNGKPKRKPIAVAQQLLAEAGYPGGVDSNTGKPLLIYYDTAASGPDSKAVLNWYSKQFEKLNIQLIIRGSDYNRFQEKMSKGTAQLFFWGWNADYPDPENFMFLLYGPNGKVEFRGENAANYQNNNFDQLFEQMKNMDSSPQRQQLINQMNGILHRDAPWLWGFHPKQFTLHHAWYKNAKANLMSHNTLQYKRIDPQLRKQKRTQWNQPVMWPLYLVIALLAVTIVPALYSYRRRERQTVQIDAVDHTKRSAS
ncbi:MAG: ABC transporter substrate-binding protein [Gammaproteobacteria bacterium]|nr:ABC transporter substrate-binding protein [Gammaproteobacteria bacterium]